MIIVIIHWRIIDTTEAKAAFFKHWRDDLKITNKRDVSGEFLSEPTPLKDNDLPFDVHNLSVGDGKSDCANFFNVGLWKSIESFESEVGPKITANGNLKTFQADITKRSILNLKECRLGEWTFQLEETCD